MSTVDEIKRTPMGINWIGLYTMVRREVQRMARVLEQHGADLDFKAMRGDLSHSHWQTVINDYRMMRKIESEEHDERAVIEQWREKVKYEVMNLASIVVILLKKNGRKIENVNRLRGEIKTAIISLPCPFLCVRV